MKGCRPAGLGSAIHECYRLQINEHAITGRKASVLAHLRAAGLISLFSPPYSVTKQTLDQTGFIDLTRSSLYSNGITSLNPIQHLWDVVQQQLCGGSNHDFSLRLAASTMRQRFRGNGKNIGLIGVSAKQAKVNKSV